MAVGQQIGVSAGTMADQFDPLIAPILPVGDLYTCHSVAAPGMLMAWRAASSADMVPLAADGRAVRYLGFNAQDVITSTAYPIDIQFGYRSVLDVDLVAIYQIGRFHLPSSDASSTIAEGDLVYPSKNTLGLLADLTNTATDGSHACPAVGRAISAPATAGAGFDVEINLLGLGAA